MWPGNINLFKQGWVAPIPPSLPKTHPLFGDIARIQISLWTCQSLYFQHVKMGTFEVSQKQKQKSETYISLRHPIELLSFSKKECSLLTCSNFQSAPNFPEASESYKSPNLKGPSIACSCGAFLCATSTWPRSPRYPRSTKNSSAPANDTENKNKEVPKFMLHMYIITRVMMANNNRSKQQQKTIMISKRCSMFKPLHLKQPENCIELHGWHGTIPFPRGAPRWCECPSVNAWLQTVEQWSMLSQLNLSVWLPGCTVHGPWTCTDNSMIWDARRVPKSVVGVLYHQKKMKERHVETF